MLQISLANGNRKTNGLVRLREIDKRQMNSLYIIDKSPTVQVDLDKIAVGRVKIVAAVGHDVISISKRNFFKQRWAKPQPNLHSRLQMSQYREAYEGHEATCAYRHDKPRCDHPLRTLP